jgi:hypothetical protein
MTRRRAVALLAVLACLAAPMPADAQGPVSPFKAGLVVPPAVSGPAGSAIHVKAQSPAKVFVWLAGSDGLDVFHAAQGVDPSQCAVRAAQPGTYRLWCVGVLNDRTATGLITVTITGDAPPGPKPDPDPKPDPPPVAVGRPWVIVIETAAGAPTRGLTFADPALTAFMKIHGHRFRIVDSGVVGADGNPPPDVAPYLARAAGKMLPQAFIVTEQGRVLYGGELPGDAAGLLALIKKVGG